MELLEERFMLDLKSRFFDIISTDNGLFQYDSMVEKMILTIKALMSAKEVTIYRYSECKQQIFVVASTNSEMKLKQGTLDIFPEELEEIAQCTRIFRKPSHIHTFKQYDLLIPLELKGEIQNYLLLKEEGPFMTQLSDFVLEKLSEECECLLQRIQQLVTLVLEEKRYKQLFRVTEKVHSSMNMESVLGEIIDTLQAVYPSFTYYLLLSQDHRGYEGLPIKELDYDDKNMTIMEAYVTGTIQFEDSISDKRSVLYAPLKGKQGVYGVLQVTAPNTLVFPTSEVEFITLLANTAGGAIENAQLYEQSQQLIADLQLINETSRCLNSNLRLSETMEYMSKQIVESLKAEEVGFIQCSSDYEKANVHPGSTRFFFTEDARKYTDYFKEKILYDHEPLFIGDWKWPHDPTQYTPFKSVMVVPMIQSNVLNGFVLVLHREPYAFSFETFKLFLSLIHHSTLAFTNTILREELEKMVITDHLTKLYSRNYLDEKIQQSMEVDGGGTFIMIDIDNFKSINDTYGHQIGDEVIVQVANIIQANIRGTDIGARWGGEELAIYLPRVSLETGVQIANRLVTKVSESSNPRVTISCGVSHWKKEENDNYKSVFKRADKALYTAKETGKNRVVVQN
ncbi:GGDEF domain-containing protein [Bacillus sp. V3B]|uniref:sensor domain-containing diguanylate cyclase n=1 Tax=Bacillus sp. V3B TaxID=2804915 RepID=UPI002108B104|nr:sensor domain-containing diguanylate cyclase [Bacillus sp. V3B]MCQ6274407.1 GGDEF domain-containing protein [Bacillus sp. V3B]